LEEAREKPLPGLTRIVPYALRERAANKVQKNFLA